MPGGGPRRQLDSGPGQRCTIKRHRRRELKCRFLMMSIALRYCWSGNTRDTVWPSAGRSPSNDVLCHHAEGIPPSHTPANQLYPRSSQNPPGKRLVTNIAVIHFGFLNSSLVGMRSLSG